INKIGIGQAKERKVGAGESRWARSAVEEGVPELDRGVTIGPSLVIGHFVIVALGMKKCGPLIGTVGQISPIEQSVPGLGGPVTAPTLGGAKIDQAHGLRPQTAIDNIGGIPKTLADL